MTNPLFAALEPTIFEVMSLAARKHGAINLGQGFPDTDGARDVREAAARALLEESNQYPPMRGLPALRAAVAAHYARVQRLEVRAQDVLITSGATEALAASLLALIGEGDEVLILDPAYDAYEPLVRRAGGVPRRVALTPPDWRITRDLLESAAGPKLRALILNDPMNPAARVFSLDEIGIVADFVRAHDLIAICDEVWEHVLFDGRAHYPLIAEPGMRERAVKIGSAGKIFALTGWKVGFAIAAPALLDPIAAAHQFLTFTTPPALQSAVAYGLAKEDAWFAADRAALQRSRDRLTAALSAGGYAVLPSEGTYFVNVDLAASGIAMRDVDFCRALVADHGVAAIPLSAFCAAGRPDTLIRLCFAKQDGTLDEAGRRLISAREILAVA
jgi:aspartate/methionine/tyrosine aminotransferase